MIKGFLLAIQFFTVLPIRREIEMNHRSVSWMIGFLPLVGAIIGGVSLGIIYFAEGFSASPLIFAFLVWLTFIILTGGLHLDGWTDVSDAYFSYKNTEKRHEILKDPRVGAFGVLSLIVLLASKFILLLDLAMQGATGWIWLIWIPVLSRLMIALLLVKSPLAREDGMAHYLKRYLTEHVLLKAVAVSLIAAIPLLFSPELWPLLLILLAGTIIFTMVSVIFFRKAFGGISGDSLGASVEGGELWSLILVWCYLSIVMG